jgi:geranylgeranyl pyrophosphate synthase
VVVALGDFGGALGTGLQMLDDLGGLSVARRHKGREDLRLLRPTWPWVWLAEESPARVGELLSRLGAGAADEAIDRVCDALESAVGERGRAAARRHLGAAWERLAAVVGPSEALDALHSEIARMEGSYG